jgi:hypothetical protein
VQLLVHDPVLLGQGVVAHGVAKKLPDVCVTEVPLVLTVPPAGMNHVLLELPQTPELREAQSWTLVIDRWVLTPSYSSPSMTTSTLFDPMAAICHVQVGFEFVPVPVGHWEFIVGQPVGVICTGVHVSGFATVRNSVAVSTHNGELPLRVAEHVTDPGEDEVT